MSAEPLSDLDTLGIAKELEASGMPQAQAEAQARIYLRYLKAVMETRLVTKEDLHNELEPIKGQINELDKGLTELNAKIDNVASNVTITMGKLVVGSVSVLGIFLTVVKFFS